MDASDYLNLAYLPVLFYDTAQYYRAAKTEIFQLRGVTEVFKHKFQYFHTGAIFLAIAIRQAFASG